MTTTVTRGTARARLVSTARRRFAQDGPLATTLDDVRREAAVSVGSLYHHFPHKGDLAAAVYVEVMRSYQSGLVELLRDQPTAEGGVREAVRHHAAWVAENPDDAVLLLGTRHESEALQEANDAMFATVRAWWGPHQEYGKLRPFHPIVTYALWLGPVQEYVRISLGAGRRDLPLEVVETFADAAWAALRAGEEGAPA